MNASESRQIIVDARGLKCPLPVLKLEKALDEAQSGGQVLVLATDPVARIDIPLYCNQRNYACEIETGDDGASRFTILKS